MKYIVGSLGLLIIPIIVRAALMYLSFPKKAEKGKVYLPKFIAVLGIITSAVFLVPTVITAFTDESVWLTVIFLFFSLAGAAIIVAFINCRVEYDENGFTHKNFLGIKRKYSYDDVTHIREDMHEDRIIAGGHKIMIDEFAVGGAEFIGFVRKQYRKRHDGLPLQTIKKDRHDIFNGNVYDAGGFVFVYILVGALILFGFVSVVSVILFSHSTPENTTEQKVVIDSSYTDGDEFVLTSRDGEMYKILYWDEIQDIDAVQKICTDTSEVTVYSDKITEKKNDSYYSVKAIKSGAEYILTFDETNRLRQKNLMPAIFFLTGLVLLWGLFVFFSVIVGRNPKKYKRFVKLFFRPEYIKK